MEDSNSDGFLVGTLEWLMCCMYFAFSCGVTSVDLFFGVGEVGEAVVVCKVAAC